MKRRDITGRSTRLLTYGLSVEAYRELHDRLKGGLKGLHMGWSLSSAVATSFEEAVSYIKEHEDLEVFYFYNQNALGHEKMTEDAIAIAKALSEHKYKPWVTLDGDVEFLKPIFENAGLFVHNDMLEFVISERWIDQGQEEPVLEA